MRHIPLSPIPFAVCIRTPTEGAVISVIRTVVAFLLIIGAGDVGLALDHVRVETRVDKAVAALGVSGAGVIVAIMDRGIDWESNDFRNDDGTTRIAYIFDLSDGAGAGDLTNGYGRGTIYTRQQIDEALFAGTTLATRDAVGHGTTSTGIAAGNGRNLPDRQYRGVAPSATIISVKVAGGAPAHGDEPAEPDWYVDGSGLFVAIDFVADKARELSMPVVMLLNLGSIGGPTDGTSAFSRKIDETVGPDHPGVVFVTGTGDDGVPSKTQNRAVGDVPNGGTRDLRFALDTGAGDLEVWYDRNEAFAVSIDTPIGMLGPYPASQLEATGTGVGLYHYRGGDDFYGSANDKRLLHIRFDGAAGAGDYILILDHTGSLTGSSIHFDASLNTPFGESGRFLNFVTRGSIWDGATAFHNVAPNSYVIRTRWTDIDGVGRELTGEGNVGELWTGSSVGPTVDGRFGVDISAPGDRIVTTYAPRSYWGSLRHLLIEDGGGLYGMAGAVSAAAPVVTGIIALMLEVDPTLDAASVKSILQETARTDEFTGQTPNALWGYGKVDAFEALLAVRLQVQEDTAPVGIESFSIPDRGGQSTTSSGTAESLRVGYGRIRAAAGSITPSGIAIFQFRNSEGVLISEAGVPASEPVQEGRIFAEVDGPVNTGLAIANPNDVPAFIQFYFTDASGTRFADGRFDLAGHQQTAKFLDQAPFNGGGSVLGTLTFTSSLPVAVVAIRGFTNEAGEFLMTTLPVAPLSVPASDTVYFPHFADGSGWVTQVILVNPTDRTITGTAGFLGQGSGTTRASPVTLALNDGRTGSSFDYSIPPRSAQRFTTSNPAGSVAVGSVRATPNSGNDAPSGLVVFSFASGGKTVSEAGVPALPKGSAFRAYVEASGTPEQAGSIRSGLAITNAAVTSNTVTLEVTHLDGSLAVPPATMALPPSGQVARFIDEIFTLPDNFSGVLRVTSTAEVAIVGLRLRVNERGELKVTTTQPSNEMDPSTSEDRFFAHMADSAGWSTQFILYSGTAGQAASGTLRFIDTSGQPLDLTTHSSVSEGLPSGTSTDVDLVVASASVSSDTVMPSQSFELRATVSNRGTGASAATTLRYYRSLDATISRGDMQVGTDAVSGLSASGASDESIRLTIPSSAGTYYYGACVDPVSGESDTGNNCSSAVLVISVDTVMPLFVIPGTLFVNPDIVTASDPTTFRAVSYAGRGDRVMFDRRLNGFMTYNAFLFDAVFTDGFTLEIQVNPEFQTSDAARQAAEKYGWLIGQLPRALRQPDFQTVWIHKGVQLFGGGNNNVLIHTGQADLYEADGILEEALIHEGAHTSLDSRHASSSGWIQAQENDMDFISTYARDHPTREDLAESFPMWIALRYRADRISPHLAATIRARMPHRLAYLDDQHFDMAPVR